MGYMDVSQIFGVLTAIVGLAVVSVAIINGDKTAKIIAESGKAFSSSINAATNPGKA
jgi:hypothetical protein